MCAMTQLNYKSRCQEIGVVQGSDTGPLFIDIQASNFELMCNID